MQFHFVVPEIFAVLLLVSECVVLLSGCTGNAYNRDPATAPGRSSLLADPPAASSGFDLAGHTPDCSGQGPAHSLWEGRMQRGDVYDFPIGPRACASGQNT